METLNCRSAFLDNMDDEMKRDVGFKRNLLTLKSEVAYEDEINGDIVDDVEDEDEVTDDDDEDDDENEDDGEEYGECYDGPYQFLSDDYDECDFTPQELQELLYQQQQQQHSSMYSLRRYSLLETIQEETVDELRMSSESDELCRSDYSGIWCWGDDYPDDCSESAKVTPSHHFETDQEVVKSFENSEDENPLSDREGSWLDFDDNLHQSSEAMCAVTDITKMDPNQVTSWSDAIDAYLMLRASSNELSHENNPVALTESASSSIEDDILGFGFGKTSNSRLIGVKSAPDLFNGNLSDDVLSFSVNNYAEDDCALNNVSTFSSFANCDGDLVGWNDDINKSQSLPCVNVDKLNQGTSSFSEVVVTPSVSTHLDLTNHSLSTPNEKFQFIHETDESEFSDASEVSSDESDEFSMFNNRSQSFLRFTRSASLRSFRSLDTLNLAGIETVPAKTTDEMDEIDGEMGIPSFIKIPEVTGEEVINDSGFLTLEGSKVDVTFDPYSCHNISTIDSQAIEKAENDIADQFPVAYHDGKNYVIDQIDEIETCSTHAPETSLPNLNEANAIVLENKAHNGSGAAELPTENSTNNESSIESVTSSEGTIPCHVVHHVAPSTNHQIINNNKVQTQEEQVEIYSANPVLQPEMNVRSLLHVNHVAGGVEGVPSCASGGWVLLCLTSDDVDPYVGHRVYVKRQRIDAKKSSLKLEESFGAIPTLNDVAQVGVGAVKNTLESNLAEEEAEKKQLVESNNKLDAPGSTNCDVVTVTLPSQPKQSVRQVQTFPEVVREGEQDSTDSSFVKLPSPVSQEPAKFLQETEFTPTKTSSFGPKMDIFTEKDKSKDKKKKSGGKKWWFLPRSKSSEPGTVHVTVPLSKEKGSSNGNVNINGKGGGSLASNGCHGDVISYEEKRKEEDLETRLDMETFTNNLWIEFENELKGVWPSSTFNGSSSSTAAAFPSPNAAAVPVTAESLIPREQHANNKQRCPDNGKIMENNSEKIKSSEVVNHVLKGKPPLPSSAHKAKVKPAGMPKIAKKISVNQEEDEEVNDPSVIFDKFRQIAKEGRDRAAKSVQNLNEIGQNFRQFCPQLEDNMADSAAAKHDEEIISGQQRRWCDSNQSLVGYLETDIDTFHSREVLVIRVPPQTQNDSGPRGGHENGTVFSNLSYNIKKHRPVKLKTQSMFNLIDDEHKIEPEMSVTTPEINVDTDDLASSGFRAAKSMEFLLKAENKAAVEAPENRLMKLRTYKGNGTAPDSEIDMNRGISEHEERIRRSLKNLNLPEWYTKSKSKTSLNQSTEEGMDDRRSLRWEDYRKRTGSSSSVTSPSKSRNTVITKRVTTPDWRQVKSSRESLAQSPSSAATSSTQLDKTDDSYGYGYAGNLSRWGSSRLSTNSSRSSSPTSNFTSTSNSTFRSSIRQQPYLGWRSSEKLAAVNGHETSDKFAEKTFYRSAAERLSKGPGYYALRFGVYSANNSAAENSDLSIV